MVHLQIPCRSKYIFHKHSLYTKKKFTKLKCCRYVYGKLRNGSEIETSDLPPGFKYKESTNFIVDLTEDDKGQWIELSDDELKN